MSEGRVSVPVHTPLIVMWIQIISRFLKGVYAIHGFSCFGVHNELLLLVVVLLLLQSSSTITVHLRC
jgi:hypothetical protein